MAFRWPRRDPRTRALADLRARDVVPTREGWLVDLAADRRLAAVGAVADDPGDDVHDALLALLADPLDEVRAAAIRALGARASAAGAQACARDAASWDPERFPQARAAAWDELEHAEAEDVPELLAASIVSRAAVGPIAPGPADALAGLVKGHPERADAALDVVLPRLGDRDPAVAARAARLAAMLGAGHQSHLVVALRDDARAPQAALALGQVGDLASVAPLAELLCSDRSPAGRAAAARALGDIGGRDAVRALRSAADDPDVTVRRSAAAALAPLAAAFGADARVSDPVGRLVAPAPPADEIARPNGHGHDPIRAPAVAPGAAAGEPAPEAAAPVIVELGPPAATEDEDEPADEAWFDEVPLDDDELADEDAASDDVPVDEDVAEDDFGVEEFDGTDGGEPAALAGTLEEPDVWSGPKTDGVPAIGPRMAPARTVPGTSRRRPTAARGRAWPRGPRPGEPQQTQET